MKNHIQLSGGDSARTFVPKRLLVVPAFAALVFGFLGLTPAVAAGALLPPADLGKAISVKGNRSQGRLRHGVQNQQNRRCGQFAASRGPSLNDPLIAESFKLINDDRVKNKFRPLTWNPGVATLSRKWVGHLLLDFAAPSWNGTWHNWNFYANYPVVWSGAARTWHSTPAPQQCSAGGSPRLGTMQTCATPDSPILALDT